MAIAWKVLNDDGSPVHGGSGRWPLPEKLPDGSWKPGEWFVESGPLKLCVPGTLHLCASTKHVVEWLGPAIFHAEYDEHGEVAREDNKIGVLRARLVARNEHWNEQTSRLFAADCAERVVKIVKDPRCDRAILAARQYAFRLISAAACAAARDAAWDAASSAAWDAASSAACAAACAVAWAAARDAAWAAACAAAWAAARDAAWAAAWAAARDAARDAERKWQVERLHSYLIGKVDLEAIKRNVS